VPLVAAAQVPPDGQSMDEVHTFKVSLEHTFVVGRPFPDSVADPLKLKLMSPMRIRPSKFCTRPWGGVALYALAVNVEMGWSNWA